MEFGDFGLFELLAVLIGLLSVHKYMISRVWLKAIFSVVVISSIVGLYILQKGDLYYICSGIIAITCLMLIAGLWEEKLNKLKTFLIKKIKKERHGN